MKDLKNELEDAETKTTELQETEVPKTQVDPLKDLKGYNSFIEKLLEENPDNPIIKDFIKYSKERVREFFYNFRNSHTSKDKGVGQTTLDKFLGTNLRSARLSDMSQVNFERLIKNSDKNGLLYSVYEWKWIGDPSIKFEAKGLSLPLKDLQYIGYSGDFDTRINAEVFESLKKYENEDVLRHHEKAIIQVLELERENIISYINYASKQFVFDPELGTLEDIHRFITDRTGKPWIIADVRKYIVDRDNVGDSVIGKYFDIRIIEAHSTKALALESEKELTLLKPHLVEGRPVLGTIFPNGLNMIQGGGGVRGGLGAQSVIFSNFLEIFALATLGLKQKEINSIMGEAITSGEFPSTQSISRFISKTNFKNFNGLQTFATAEIFWKLIKKYSRASLINILPFGGGVFDSQLYKGLGYKCSELQRAISMGCDNVDDIQHYLDVDSNIFKGFLREEVISFFIDKKIRFEEIALKFGLSNGKSFIGYVKTTLSPALTGGMQLIPIDLRCYLRKQVCIEFLRMGYSPEFILSEIFHYQVFRYEYVNKYTVYSKFKAIFKDEGLNFAEIIEKYCPDPDTIITQYKSKVRIMFQDM